MTAPTDEIDRLRGPVADAVSPLRAARPGVVEHPRIALDALLVPTDGST